MRARTAAFILSGVLVAYLSLCVWKAAQAIHTGLHPRPHSGSASSVLLGVGLLIFGFAGSAVLVREIKIGLATDRLATTLAAEDALHQHEIDNLPRTKSGRVDQPAAARLITTRKAETEAAPDDWRTWYRLAVAYSTTKDNACARATMRQAIRLHQHDRPPT